MADYVIYFRDCREWQQESAAARNYFHSVPSRMYVANNSCVIPRYSALPFYQELEGDMLCNGSRLINTYQQHRYVADLKNWCVELCDVTPRSWNDVSILPEDGQYILKGETNSMKQLWSTHMFANGKREAIEVAGRLYNDNLIGEQQIYVREYAPLVTYMTSLRGLPITKEFRFFFYKKHLLTSGYYWANHVDEVKEKLGYIPSPSDVPQELIDHVTSVVSQHINFYVVDFAQKENGDWIVIELNDGSMSGLSCCSPWELYENLKRVLK